MNEDPLEDWLDARLREAAPYIDDAGFTAQVLQKLPAQRASRTSFRGAILLGMTLLACIVTYLASDGGRFLISAAATLAAMPLWILAFIAVFCSVVGTATAAGVAYQQVRVSGDQF